MRDHLFSRKISNLSQYCFIGEVSILMDYFGGNPRPTSGNRINILWQTIMHLYYVSTELPHFHYKLQNKRNNLKDDPILTVA